MATPLRRKQLNQTLHPLFRSSPQAITTLPTPEKVREATRETVRGRGKISKAAQSGYALSVSGNGAATLGQLSQPASTNGVTFEVWMQSTTKSAQGLFQLAGAQAASPAPFISLANDQITVAWSGTTFTSTDTTPVTDGAWHHIAVVFDRGTLTLYKDGLPTGDDFALPQGQSFPTGTNPQVAAGGGSVAAFTGNLFDIRVWTTVRKQAELQGYMYLPLTGKEAGLSLLWNFPTASVGNQVNGTTGGTTGNASILQMPLPSQPPPLTVWTYPTLSSTSVAVGPVMTSSALIQAVTMTNAAGNLTGLVNSIDLQNNTINWTYDTLQNTPPDSNFDLNTQISSLVVEDGVAYVGVSVGYIAGDQIEYIYTYVHAINVDTGQKLWVYWYEILPATLGSTLQAANGVVYLGWLTYDITNETPYAGGFMAINGQNTILWSNNIAVEQTRSLVSFTSAAVTNDIVVYGANFFLNSGQSDGALYGVNPSTGAQLWRFPVGGQVSSEPVIVDGVVYLANDAGTVYAVNLNTGVQIWSYQAGGQIVASPAFLGANVYVANQGGTFFALDKGTGQLKWEFATGNVISTDILIQDGVAFFAASASSAPLIYAVDLATAAADVITYTAEYADVILFSNAGSGGVVYFYGFQTIYAVNMENILHEFQVDTKLIVENYDTTTSPPTPTDTSYRVTMTLYDPNKTPRAYQGIKLWATDTLSLTSDTVAYTIGPTQPVWLETDAVGQVTFAISAVDSDGTPYVTLPAIQAWANFMQVQEAIVIYPDHENLGKLATVQGNAPASARSRSGLYASNPLYLNQATGYDGQPMILSTYQSPAALNLIAQTVANTVGLRPTTAQGVGPVSTPTKYLAYPETMPNVAYQSDSSQSTGRTYFSGAVPHWVSAFDPTTGAPSFQQLTSAEAAQQIQQALSGAQNSNAARPGQPATPLKSIFTDIGDFFKNVVKGAEQVARTIWHAIESGIEAVIETAENLYHLVISTVEDAVKAVVGFFKRIVADVKKVIQWLSWLFDWTDFVTTHNQIKQTVQTNLTALQTWINTQISADLSDVNAFFAGLENTIDDTFGTIITSLQGKSLGNVRAQHNNTQQIYTQGGQNYHGPCLWLHQKTKENLKATSLSAPGGSATFSLYIPSMTKGALGDAVSLDDVMVSAFETFLDSVKASIDQEFASFPQSFVAFGHSFAELFANKKTFLQNALADLLGLIQTIVDDLISIAADIVKAFLVMLQSIINALVDYVTNPPAVSIPFVSSLYQSITGQPLSWFDLVAMIVSIPATIMFKVFTSLSLSGAAATLPQAFHGIQSANAVPQILDWANFFILIVTGIVDPIADISDDFPGLAIFDFILNLYAQGVSGLLVNWPFSKWKMLDYLFWAYQWMPVVFSGYSLALSKSESDWAQLWSESLQTWCLCIYGIGGGVLTAIMAKFDWSNYGGLALAENILTPTLYNAIEPLKLLEGTTAVVMEVIKAGMAVAYAIMNLVGQIDAQAE